MALQPTQRQTITLGWAPFTVGATSTINLNAANTWAAFSFVACRAVTLNTVRVYWGAKSGTVVAGDARCDLYSDSSAGIPNASLENKTADGAPSANAWGQFSSFTTSLTAGARYWIIFRNLNATPASNNFSVSILTTNAANTVNSGNQGTTTGWGWEKLQTADGGSTWTSGGTDQLACMRLTYNDSTYDGVGIQSGQAITTASQVFGKRELGVVFTCPANIRANVRRIGMHINSKTGTPAGNLQFKIWNGATLLATSYAIPQGNIVTASYYEAAFSADAVIAGGQTIRVTASQTVNTDTSSNRYNIVDYTIENDSNSKNLKPFDGTLSRTESADNTASPVVFSDTDTSLVPMIMHLDTSGEFAVQAFVMINE